MLNSELCIFMSRPWSTCGHTQGLVRIAPAKQYRLNFMSQLRLELSHAGPATQDKPRLLDKLRRPTGVGSSDLIRRQALHCFFNRKNRSASVKSISTPNSPPTMTGTFVTLSQLACVGVGADCKVYPG